MLTELSQNGECLPILFRLNSEYQGGWELPASTRRAISPSAASYHRLRSFYIPLVKKLIVTVLVLEQCPGDILLCVVVQYVTIIISQVDYGSA